MNIFLTYAYHVHICWFSIAQCPNIPCFKKWNCSGKYFGVIADTADGRTDGWTVPYHDPSRLRASVRKCKYPIFAYGHHTMNANKSKNDHSNRWTTFETLKLSSAKSRPFFHTDTLAAWLVIPWLMRYSSCTEAVMIRVYHFKFQRKLDNHFGIWITDDMYNVNIPYTDTQCCGYIHTHPCTFQYYQWGNA